MEPTQIHLRFYQNLDRLRKLKLGFADRPMKLLEFLMLTTIEDYHKKHPEVQGIYVSALADQLDLAVPAVSKQLRHMEQQGWLVRTVDQQNRRNTFVSLSAPGRKALTEEESFYLEMSSRVFQQMGEERCLSIIDGISEILDLLEETALQQQEAELT
ncbi:MAG: MarR family transcriptional regulator [Clostridiales bacterium]|nr:MarR family transcriptional regulator [Clostridiales bacterium]